MPINTDRSTLAPQSVRIGMNPDRDPRFLTKLMEAWLARQYELDRIVLAKAMPDLPYRGSYAGSRCDRQLHYQMTDGEVSDEMTIADYWRFAMGKAAHKEVQDVMAQAFPGSDIEVIVDLQQIGIPGSARADIVAYYPCPTCKGLGLVGDPIQDKTCPGCEGTRRDDGRVFAVIEVKSINGFGFKSSAIGTKAPPEGPKWGSVVQGALAAHALGAEKLIIVQLSLENVGPDLAKRFCDTELGRFGAQWTFTRDEVAAIAELEQLRIERVNLFAGTEHVPPRELHDPSLPVGAVVFNPTKGEWSVKDGERVLRSGTKWFCNYCSYREKCITDGPGGVPVQAPTF